MELRKYQTDLIDDLRSEMRDGKQSICAVLGCGGGKSVIAANIAKMTTESGKYVLFLVHRKELCQQITNTFIDCGVNMWHCKIEMVQTAVRRLKTYKIPSLIIVDETHHILSNSYLKIINYFPKAYKIGFTATPMRMGGKGLGEVFNSLVESVSTKWLIENKYLSPYSYYSVKLVETKGLHIKKGEYVQSEVDEIMSAKTIYGDTIKNYKKYADGKKTIVYCSGISNSKLTCKEFIDSGISAAHLDGNTPKIERQQTIQAFRNGEITVLCNVDLFGEGFDVPDCECVILLRPTASLTLHIQQSMRSMRYLPEKKAIIIDHVGNVFTHGLPDDVREWTLESKKNKNKLQSKSTIKECPECYACMPSNAPKCTECGYVFGEEKEPEQVKKVDIILSEIVPEDILKSKPYDFYKNIKTWEELERFRMARGYKSAWTVHKAFETGIEIPANKYFYAQKVLKYAQISA